MALKTSQKARNPKWRKDREGTGRVKMVLLLIGGGVILLIVLILLILPRSSDRTDRDQLRSLELRLQQMERKMTRLERQGNKLSKLEEEFKNYALKMMDRVDSIEKSLVLTRKRLTAKSQTGYTKKAAQQPVKKTPSKPRTAPGTQAGKQYHTVRPGETLYRISLRYGLTVNELLRINNLGPGAVIRPGQKLLFALPRQ